VYNSQQVRGNSYFVSENWLEQLLTMPRCKGRPDGACPNKRNDVSVRNRQGDLMLCDECDEYRRVVHGLGRPAGWVGLGWVGSGMGWKIF